MSRSQSPAPVERVDPFADAPLSADEQESLLYTMLPLLLRRSVPKVGSIRRSISGYAATRRYAGDSGSESTGSGSTTPPPPYREVLVPLTSVRRSLSPLLDDDSDTSPKASSSEGASRSASPAKEGAIQWKYASQGTSNKALPRTLRANILSGLTLLTHAAQESASCSDSAPFSRRLYIDSLTYLLRGLPATLSEEEQSSLRAALPAELSAQVSADRTVVRPPPCSSSEPEQPRPEPTLLHRLVAMATLQLFVILSFLLPYIQSFVRYAYQYERDNRISERLFAHGVSTADSMGRRTYALSRAICALNDGKVGEAIEDAGAWCIQGFTGGVYEGVGEGMEVLGLRREVKTTRRRRVRA